MSPTSNESSEPGPYPPRPRLTLRVAVSGHRPKPQKFPETSFDFVRQRFADVFKAIDAALQASHEKNGAYYAEEPHKVRLVSGLAEGADQLAIEMRPAGWEVDAILPFPVQSYRLDFKQSATGADIDVLGQFDASLRSATTVLQLPEDQRSLTDTDSNYDKFLKSRSYAYARDIDVFIRQSDILVAVWDGKPADGPGGTAEVIQLALDASIPVIWISSQTDTFPRLVEEVEEDGQPLAPPADCLRGSLQEAISTVVSVPVDQPHFTSEHGTGGLTARQRLETFLKETWPDRSSWTTYDRFKRWMQGLSQRSHIVFESIENLRLSWSNFIEEAPPAGDLGTRLLDVLLPRYAWADALAIDLSNRFRSAYIKAYLMAAAAVVIALFGIFFAHGLSSATVLQALALKALLVVPELYLIYRILVIVRKGRRARWQERWIEYRALAEILRDLRFLAYFGEYGYIQRPEDIEPASSAWFLWYLRATIRELGLPHAVLDGAYQRAHLITVEKKVVEDQIRYHENNANTLWRMHRFLNKTGECCFLATFALLSVFLIALALFIGMHIAGSTQTAGGFLVHALGNPLTFLVAGLPAIGAAMAGIRETGDFEGFAERSAKTLAELRELTRKFDAAKRRLRLDTTGAVLLSTARVLTADLAAWQAIYGRKRLNFPT
jgi:hypothetical protein